MKTTNRILILMAVISFMACKNQMHVVTLYVNTDNIKQGSIDANANFNQPVGIANKDFITNVRKGDMVIWQGMSVSDPEHKVSITSIEPVEGERLFKLKSFNGQKVNNNLVGKKGYNEQVAVTIKLKPGNDEAYVKEKYNLKFTVSNKAGTFIIDPYIKANQ
ncbi:MAG: hypothetical protein WBM77_12725 [Maribacter sp.]